MSYKRYEYKVRETTEVTRYYTIECEEELHDDVFNNIRELISKVDITSHNPRAECQVNGIECDVTFDDTDNILKGQIDYNLHILEDILENGEWSEVAAIYDRSSKESDNKNL
jgi:hypothetical protein